VIAPAHDVALAIRAKIPADGGLFTRSRRLTNQPFDRFAQRAKKGTMATLSQRSHTAGPYVDGLHHILEGRPIYATREKSSLGWFESWAGSPGLAMAHTPSAFT